ncbi:Gfo/Idh/MocA family oxidoreductase [bacterium]|nr:Gfo/Idh/MocA family oxidoreductase [bacterium]
MAERIIICGTGSIGMQHADLLIEMGALPILIPVRAGRYEELKKEGYEVVAELDERTAELASCCIIATETNRHVEDAIRAMDLGLRVLVEKPLGVSAEDIARFENIPVGRGLDRLRVVCPLRWYEAISVVKRELGSLGRIHTVNICCQSYLPDWRPRQDYQKSYSASPEQGGVVRDLVHEIDYCNFLFGLPDAENVRFTGTTGASIGIESTSNALLSWKMGEHALVSIQLDYLTRSPRRMISVFGESGEIQADLISGEVNCVLVGRESEIHSVENDRSAAMEQMLKSFLNDNDAGCNYHEALEAARIVDACENSIRNLK